MIMGGIACQDKNLVQLSRVCKEKPPIKKNLVQKPFVGSKTFRWNLVVCLM